MSLLTNQNLEIFKQIVTVGYQSQTDCEFSSAGKFLLLLNSTEFETLTQLKQVFILFILSSKQRESALENHPHLQEIWDSISNKEAAVGLFCSLATLLFMLENKKEVESNDGFVTKISQKLADMVAAYSLYKEGYVEFTTKILISRPVKFKFTSKFLELQGLRILDKSKEVSVKSLEEVFKIKLDDVPSSITLE